MAVSHVWSVWASQVRRAVSTCGQCRGGRFEGRCGRSHVWSVCGCAATHECTSVTMSRLTSLHGSGDWRGAAHAAKERNMSYGARSIERCCGRTAE
eukprot:scaffold98556_cov75-Phaeocystis_antarctica.AAC.2